MSDPDGPGDVSGSPGCTGPPGEETYAASFEPEDRPSESVVATIAALAGEEPTELTPLYEAVEPDAIDALVEHARRTGHPDRTRLTFAYAGYEVSVRGDGRILVSLPSMSVAADSEHEHGHERG